MEKKQRPMFSLRKLIYLLIFLVFTINALGQNNYTLNGSLKVTAVFNKNDSTLIVNYRSTIDLPILIWVGDFSVATIANRNDISAKYLASPIVNEIYLVNKRIKTFKITDSYFLRNDSSELNLYNYRQLGNGQSIQVKMLLNSDTLFQLINAKEMIIKGAVSFVSIPRIKPKEMDPYAIKSTALEPRKWMDLVDNYTTLIPEYSEYLNPIILKKIPFEFNRLTKQLTMNGNEWAPHYGDLSKVGLIKPLNQTQNKAEFISFEHLYRFVNKHYFSTTIEIK
jgi:hypothetical protein